MSRGLSAWMCAAALLACGGSETRAGDEETTTSEPIGTTDATSSRGDGTGSIDPGIVIEPSTAELYAFTEQSFTAVISGVDDMSVSWSVVEDDGGQIDDSGHYSAPPYGGTFHVRATSVTDPTIVAEASVSVEGRAGKSDGSVTVLDVGSETATDALVDSDGAVYVVGRHHVPSLVSQRMFLTKVKPEGGLDTQFGNAGLLLVDSLTTLSSRGAALHMPAAGTLLAGGGGGNGGPEMMFARLSTAGVLDGSFGTSGVVQTAEITAVRSLAGAGSDRFVAVTGAARGEEVRLFEADATLVAEFGGDGAAEAIIPTAWESTWGTSTYEIRDIIVQDDGKILVLGISRAPGYSTGVIVVARLTAEGELDQAFGIDGVYLHYKDGVAAMDAQTFVRLHDGRLLIAGRHDGDFVVGRLLANGLLDNSFGDDGWVQHVFERNIAYPASSTPYAMQVMADEKTIVVCGLNGRGGLLRLSSDGEVDLGFGDDVGDGWGLVGGSESFVEVTPVALLYQPPNRLIVVGNSPDDDGYSAVAVHGAYAY